MWFSNHSILSNAKLLCICIAFSIILLVYFVIIIDIKIWWNLYYSNFYYLNFTVCIIFIFKRKCVYLHLQLETFAMIDKLSENLFNNVKQEILHYFYCIHKSLFFVRRAILSLQSLYSPDIYGMRNIMKYVQRISYCVCFIFFRR